jgi:hypothetical protein
MRASAGRRYRGRRSAGSGPLRLLAVLLLALLLLLLLRPRSAHAAPVFRLASVNAGSALAARVERVL